MTSTNGRGSRGSSRQVRPPGSVAEIAASPAGPAIGAFFDMDGTLVAGFTAVVLSRHRLLRRDMGVGELIAVLLAGLSHHVGRIEFEALITTASSALRGRPLSALEELGERLFAQKIAGMIYPEMRELVHAHLARGHTVVLSSSALTIQVDPVARYLGISHTLTNRFETDHDGVLTGNVARPILWGAGKAAAVQEFAAERGVDLNKSYFYADGDEDVALMHLVGHPRPTNPQGKMAAVARRRGWPVLRFTSRSSVGIGGQVRALAGVGSVLPLAASALALGLLTRSRRRAVNFFISTWPRLMLGAGGVRLDVIGAKNLTARRPAVFIYNHRNQIDPFIAGGLVGENWVTVAKKELKDDPIMGPIGKLVDAAFVDRDDAASAVQTLHEVEARAKNGLSIIIAPEGTRLDTTGVGPFKKGPFRIAMAAGIPIVPIVIRNAQVITSRDSMTLHPGTVDVAVFPPIPVDDWTVDTLADRIAEVRQLYLDALADWPTEELPVTADHPHGTKRAAQPNGNKAAQTQPKPQTQPKQSAAKKPAPAKKAEPAKRTAAKQSAGAATKAPNTPQAQKKAAPDGPDDATVERVSTDHIVDAGPSVLG